jgi:hypothetical protein
VRKQIIAAMTASWTVACVLALVILENTYEQPTRYALHYSWWLGVELSGAVLEMVLWAYSASLVWGLSMTLSRRMKVVALFGCRLLYAAQSHGQGSEC